MHLEHRMDDLPTPVRHTAHGNLPESCRISSPSPEAMNFVLVMFTWRPLDSNPSFHALTNPSFHALTRSTHSSREVAMITRSSAKNSSQGTPTLKSLDKASSTMIKSSGLRTEPWCTPTPTSNTSLYSEPTLTRLRALQPSDLSSVRSSDIHLRVVSQKIPQPSVIKISLKTAWLRFHSNRPGPMS